MAEEGVVDPELKVAIYDTGKAYPGTTFLADGHDPETGEVAWRYVDDDEKNWPLRDANRLPNGNTLITGLTKVFEVTPDGETVWRLELQGVRFADINEAKRFGLYKADRIPPS